MSRMYLVGDKIINEREYKTENYSGCLSRLPLMHRSVFATVRCGMAPIRIEKKKKKKKKKKTHAILQFSLYNDTR